MLAPLAKKPTPIYLDIKTIEMTSDPFTSRQKARQLALGCRGGAIVAVVVVSAYWWTKGAHLGWSQNLIPTAATDEITGLEYVTYKSGFTPGIDLLAVGGAGAVLLWIVSLFLGRRTDKNSSHQ